LNVVDPKAHWDKVYRTKRPNEVSWYRPHLDVSLQLIKGAAAQFDAQIIDVGGGESTLIDDLLAVGYHNVSVLDLSLTALDVAKGRLGDNASKVNWLCGDAMTIALDRHRYDVWHDRAVFHFLTDPKDRAGYVRQVAHAVKPGGHVIVAMFGPEGPTKCSGLDVVRYGPESLHGEFGASFRLIRHLTELHKTPAGSIQQFTYCYCNLSSGAF
jgi:SAM-dependent methyltransferase